MAAVQLLSPEALISQVRAIRAKAFKYTEHPFIVALRDGKAPKKQVQEWAKQMYIVLNHTGRSNGFIYANCADPDLRPILANVIADEETSTQCGSDSHINLHAKFCRALGITDEELRAERPVAAVKEGLEWLMDVRKNKPSALALSTSIEEPAVGLWELLADAFRKHYGLNDDDVEMWTVHAEGDKEHGDLGSQLILGYGKTAERQREVLDTVKKGVENFWRIFDGTFRAHELPRVGEPGWAWAPK
jgi:pyrroloquinoline quinone (PQQ) biosynthesis protein C